MAVQDSYRGDAHAEPPHFEVLVEAHYEALYRFAMSLAHSPGEAGDLVQDTFVTWANKGHQLTDATKARAWLFTTLHRAFLQSKRRLTRFPHVGMEEAKPELEAVEPDAMNRLDGLKVVDLLGKVDAQYQAAVALFYLEDYSYEQIAEVLEVPLGTVKSRISRGIKQLKDLVLNEPGLEGLWKEGV